VRDTLAQYPRLRATRLFEMVRTRGYLGSVVQLRRVVRTLRPARTPTLYRRLTTLPAEDYGESAVMVSPEEARQGGAVFFRTTLA
jgi:hypothetical protein